MEPLLQPALDMDEAQQPVDAVLNTSSRPQVTISNTPEYCHRIADITARALLSDPPDPLNVLFQRDWRGPLIEVNYDQIYEYALSRAESKTKLGASIVEADTFAAVACWDPRPTVEDDLSARNLEELAEKRPVFAAFIRDSEETKMQCLGIGQKHLGLSLMARDPLKTSEGAVRAVIEPLVERAKEQKLPIWLIAGNERARDVYAHFGFEVVKVIYSGEERVRSWCMVCNWPAKR
ncbi:hypothetical protein BT63DRAFT_200336 [Microthyrium microscopicum]|uniref:N-acetyltransferase domain-containing protein n=1 Tax=Microthyrium microscopicum TaxID=703497 RepID=A0A6A6UG13_9PEZI|nr:hypothetical protein BT63DRAFT_200336 [Microthyrium microscopicum]